jgi:hypothetical protein
MGLFSHLGTQSFDQFDPFAGRDVLEADLGLVAREFDGSENAPIDVRTKVRLERRVGSPSLDEDDGWFRALLLVDVARGATGLGPHGPLDGSQDLEHGGAPVRRREDPDRTDDHGYRSLLNLCQGLSRHPS